MRSTVPGKCGTTRTLRQFSMTVAWVLAFICCACATDARDRSTVFAEASTFAEFFQCIDSITLATGDSSPIVRISGFTSRRDTLVISDPSTGYLHAFDRTGHYLWRVAGQGFGPGELQVPIDVQFDSLGFLHVLDVEMRRMSTFGPDGEFLRSEHVEEPGIVFEFALRPSGGYVFAGRQLNEPEALFLVDSVGSAADGLLPLFDRPIAGAKASPMWRTVARVSLVHAGDSVVALHSLIDSLYFVVGDNVVRRLGLPVVERDMQAPPSGRGATREIVQSWSHDVTTSTAVEYKDGILVAYFKGVYNDAAATDLAVMKGGEWTLVHNAPAFVGAIGDTLVAVRDYLADELRLLLYVERQ